jgi:hypothetical protein
VVFPVGYAPLRFDVPDSGATRKLLCCLMKRAVRLFHFRIEVVEQDHRPRQNVPPVGKVDGGNAENWDCNYQPPRPACKQCENEENKRGCQR